MIIQLDNITIIGNGTGFTTIQQYLLCFYNSMSELAHAHPD